MNSTVLPDLVELCHRQGIRDVILCPGSRSAPLILAFVRNKKIHCRTFSDERSAAFVALGIAQQTGNPVALVCTSGSAALNFAPAIAEAYFQQLPLIVFTADRPKEWIDQLDGQTIRQSELYGKHVKRYFELPHDYTHADSVWYANRIVNEAINLATAGPAGPVQINAPFREPLYDGTTEPAASIRVITRLKTSRQLSQDQWLQLVQRINKFQRVLVVAGQHGQDPALIHSLQMLYKQTNWPIAGDILSNLHALPNFIRHTDTFLGHVHDEEKTSLQPDLLITFGKSVIAKNLKLFLRGCQPKEHWHIQPCGEPADTFQGLTQVIALAPSDFFTAISQQVTSKPEWSAYATKWTTHENHAVHQVNQFFGPILEGEFALVRKVLSTLPSQTQLHLANSMSVRYANHIGLSESQSDITVFSNRGTSGIDGCTSTAVGNALVTQDPVVLITGDLAFFYDRNAFWHNYPLPNLYVVLLNNHGGIIFNLIDGPSRQPEAAEFFITRQPLNARSLSAEFGLHHHVGNQQNVAAFFARKDNAGILEIESSQELNKKIVEEFRSNLKKSYEA